MTLKQDHALRKYQHTVLLICNSCVWATSFLDGDNPIQACPICTKNLESIPITDTETYRLRLDGNGISIEFWNTKH